MSILQIKIKRKKVKPNCTQLSGTDDEKSLDGTVFENFPTGSQVVMTTETPDSFTTPSVEITTSEDGLGGIFDFKVIICCLCSDSFVIVKYLGLNVYF